MAGKKFYWLKLKPNYFESLLQKRMRKLEDGASMCLIYIKLMLFSLENDGVLLYQGLFDSIDEELAELLNEDYEIVHKTTQFLLDKKAIELKGNNYYIPEAIECTGKESESAERVRRHRKAKEKVNEALQCNDDVTKCNTDKEKELDEELNKELDEDNCQQPTFHLNDVEKVWFDTFSCYPKKGNSKEARELWEKRILNSDNQLEEAKAIANAILLYLSDYETSNRDDNNFTYLKNLSRWFDEDSDYWIALAKNKTKEQTQQEEEHINLWDEEEREMTDEEWLKMMQESD